MTPGSSENGTSCKDQLWVPFKNEKCKTEILSEIVPQISLSPLPAKTSKLSVFIQGFIRRHAHHKRKTRDLRKQRRKELRTHCGDIRLTCRRHLSSDKFDVKAGLSIRREQVILQSLNTLFGTHDGQWYNGGEQQRMQINSAFLHHVEQHALDEWTGAGFCHRHQADIPFGVGKTRNARVARVGARVANL